MKKIKQNDFRFFCLIAIVSGILLSFFNAYFSNSGFKIREKKISNVRNQLILRIANPEPVLLKIWGKDFPQNVYFNHERILPVYEKIRNRSKEQYFHLSASQLRVGQNILFIDSRYSFSVRTKNYLYSDSAGNIAIIFKGLPEADLFFRRFIRMIIPFIIFSVFFIIAGFFLLRIFLKVKLHEVLLICLLIYGAYFLIMLLLSMVFSFTPCRLVVSGPLMFCWLLATSFLVSTGFLLVFINKECLHSRFRLPFKKQFVELLNNRLSKVKIAGFSAKVIKYIHGDFLHWPVWIGVLLFLQCIVFLAFGLYSFAKYISYIVYFCLLFGLIRQLAVLIKEKGE